MKITIISDTHGQHQMIADVPSADVLIHCGDFAMDERVHSINKFNDWLGTIKDNFKHIIVVPGNHDEYCEHNNVRDILSNAIYLQDEEIIIDGVKFYGMPWVPKFFDWAFMLPRNSYELKAKVDAIPHDTNVLITHGPAFGRLDYARKTHVGCELLHERISTMKAVSNALKLHCFGHIHSSYGVVADEQTIYVNAALCDDYNFLHNIPIEVNI
jgi:Icc-related predicted phosphoesterase